VALAADVQRRRVLDRQARGDGDAVPALLAGDLQVRQPGVDEGRSRKLALAALDLLQTQHVGRRLKGEANHLLGPQAYGIDVPGGESQVHAQDPAQKSRPDAGARAF